MNAIELQSDEYLGKDGLAYCKNCHTPRVCHIDDRYFPVACKCRQEVYKKAENERKLQERKAKAVGVFFLVPFLKKFFRYAKNLLD